MSAADIVIAGILLIFIVLLLRADKDIGRNDYQRLREFEKLVGPLPQSMRRSDRLHLISWQGISSGDLRRTALIAIAVAAFVLLLFLGRS